MHEYGLGAPLGPSPIPSVLTHSHQTLWRCRMAFPYLALCRGKAWGAVRGPHGVGG